MATAYERAEVREPLARAIAHIAAAQHGIFSREQAIDCGAASATITRRVTSGAWERLYPGVYRLAGSPVTFRQKLFASCLACGAGCAVSHRAAATLWKLPGFDSRICELSLPRANKRDHGDKVHRPMMLESVDITQIEGIPVTTVARTLIDIAACVPVETLEEALDDALRQRLVTLKRLRRRLDELGGPGRAGCAALVEMIDARAGNAAVTQSVFETRLLRALKKAALPLPTLQHMVRLPHGRAFLDFAYIEQKLAIEAVGFKWHSSSKQWEHDLVRSNALAILGWKVIEVTWSQLHENPQKLVSSIQALVGEA